MKRKSSIPLKTLSLMLIRLVFAFIFFLISWSCSVRSEFKQEMIDKAIYNSKMASEGFERSYRFVQGWLTKTDSVSGLIPTNLTNKKNIWEPHNSGADNYAFMVLTAYMLDKGLYEGEMKEMLNSERKLTSRIKTLPDSWSFPKQDFQVAEIYPGNIIYGTSEYIKDGLIPLMEYIGTSAYNDRMMEMLDDLREYMKENGNLETIFRERMASVEEVNGELLQTLSRVYWMTGDRKYLEWALEIGDYYMLGQRDLSRLDYLRIRDHGCEIIGGLSELYMTLHFVNRKKKEQYKPAMYKLLDRILEVGRNEDGLFYNAVNPRTGEIIDGNTVDNWGYVFNAYYTVWMIDQKKAYREAVLKGFENLNEKYRAFAWEGTSHDGYADALESGINLYNREPVSGLKSWIDSEMQVMFSMQQEDGIIGGWHGDGNFARTALMYSLWNTMGARIDPWHKKVHIGAVQEGNEVYFVITSEMNWQGKLLFDAPRSKSILHLPMDYPRINQFPEWFTADEKMKYQVVSSKRNLSRHYKGKDLTEGIEINLSKDEMVVLVIKNEIAL